MNKDRIVDLVVKLSENSNNFTDILKTDSEYYFRYKGHAFSILIFKSADEGETDYHLYIYPDYEGDFTKLAIEFEHPNTSIHYVHFSVKDYAEDPRARKAFSKLYKSFGFLGIDEVLNDILD